MEELNCSDYHILLIDDSAPMLKIITLYLEKAGFRVTAVSDGKVAISKVEEGDFDIIITDIFMPQINGFELIKRMKAKKPVIMISGADAENISKGIADLSDVFISKDIKQDEFVSAVKKSIIRFNLDV